MKSNVRMTEEHKESDKIQLLKVNSSMGALNKVNSNDPALNSILN